MRKQLNRFGWKIGPALEPIYHTIENEVTAIS
jgi:hypothetical protein